MSIEGSIQLAAIVSSDGVGKSSKFKTKEKCCLCGKKTVISNDVNGFIGFKPICRKCKDDTTPAIERRCLKCDELFLTKTNMRVCDGCKNFQKSSNKIFL